MRFSDVARVAWWAAYRRLAEPVEGIVGGLLARAEAHVLRLALLYALIDGASSIGPAHLDAALALWDYAAASVSWAFGEITGDPVADAIHATLVTRPQGMTRTEIRDLLGRNRSGLAIDAALASLARTGRAQASASPPPAARSLDRGRSAGSLITRVPLRSTHTALGSVTGPLVVRSCAYPVLPLGVTAVLDHRVAQHSGGTAPRNARSAMVTPTAAGAPNSSSRYPSAVVVVSRETEASSIRSSRGVNSDIGMVSIRR
jgi:hypothetical protein